MCVQKDIQRGGRIHREMDRLTDGQTYRQRDGQRDEGTGGIGARLRLMKEY